MTKKNIKEMGLDDNTNVMDETDDGGFGDLFSHLQIYPKPNAQSNPAQKGADMTKRTQIRDVFEEFEVTYGDEIGSGFGDIFGPSSPGTPWMTQRVIRMKKPKKGSKKGDDKKYSK
jgi:hypothetical protein